MLNEFLSPAEAAARIRAGHVMAIAGSADRLAGLPQGRWIGGSTVYFMTADGGRKDGEHLFCTTFPAGSTAVVRHLATDALPDIAQGYAPGGVSLIVLPAFSTAHAAFAEHSAEYPRLFDQPLAGWISGVAVEQIGKAAPEVIDGSTGQRHGDGAVLLHVTLPPGTRSGLDIVNMFEPGDGPVITFAETGFAARKARIDGHEVDFATWMQAQAIDTRWPLMADYAGAAINVSFQSVDPDTGVQFYAPVFPGVEYRLARPQGDYAGSFAARMGSAGAGQYSCNCILNYLYGELEGRQTGGFTGPVTFGEIAYILLNQTLVKLDIAA